MGEKMKKILTLILTLIAFNNIATATEKFDCEASLPQGKVEIVVEENQSLGKIFNISFQNKSLNESYTGVLNNLKSIKDPNYVVAFGTLSTNTNEANVTLQGSLEPNEYGFIVLALYAQRNSNIEYGYGNWLRCEKVKN